MIYFLVNAAGGTWSAGSLVAGLRAVARRLSGPPPSVLQGIKVHLWFLLALSLAVYAVGLAGRAYADTPFGFQPHVNLRNGLCFRLLMFASGVRLRRLSPAPACRRIAPAVALGGLVRQLAEVAWLHARWGTDMAQDFTLGT